MSLEKNKKIDSSIYEILLKEDATYSAESSRCALKFLLVAHDFHLRLEALFREFDLSSQRFNLLLALKLSPQGLAPSEIAKLEKVSRATATQYIDPLVKRDLVYRMNSKKDRRFLFVRLTRKGHQILNKLLPLHNDFLEHFTSALSVSERRVLVELLAKVEADR